MNRNFAIAAGLALLEVTCWSGNWVLGRAVRAEIPPLGLNFWRWTVAAIVLLPFAVPRWVDDWRAVRANLPSIALLALTGAAAFQSMIYVGLRSTEAVNALLLNATAPLFVVLIARILLGEPVRARHMTGIAISFAGVAWLVARGDLSRLLALTFNPGDGWIVSAMFVWGLYSVLLKMRPAGLSAIGLTFWISVLGALMMLPAHLLDGRSVPFTGASLASIAYTGIAASVIAFLAFNAAVGRIGPSRAVYFLHLMPVTGTLLAMLFLGETLEFYHVIGFPLALAGVLWATTGGVT